MLSFYVKFVQTDRLTDGQTDNSKTTCPLIFRYGGIIKGIFITKIVKHCGKRRKCWSTLQSPKNPLVLTGNLVRASGLSFFV